MFVIAPRLLPRPPIPIGFGRVRTLILLLERFGRLRVPPAPASPERSAGRALRQNLSGQMLRDIGLAEGAEAPARRAVFSFRIHPISEFVEHRDRLSLATLPEFGNR